MKIRLAFAAITVTTLSVVLFTGCSPDAPPIRLSVCQEASAVPPYRVTYDDGSVVEVPSGDQQLSAIGPVDVPLSSVCAAIVGQWDHDRKSKGYVDLGQ